MTFLLCRNGVAKLTTRRLLQLRGVDASRFIQAILTNDMKHVTQPGDAIYGGFLTTKGRLLGDCNVVQTHNDTYVLDYDAGVQDDLMKHWKRYKLRMKLTLDDTSDDFDVLAALPALFAPDSSDNSVPYSAPHDALDAILQQNARKGDAASADGSAVFIDPRGVEFGVRAILRTGDALTLPESYETVDDVAYTDRRILLGAAEGRELVDAIPLESNLELLRGVSFRKGCYVGQELTARTQFKGNVRKRLVPLALVPRDDTDVVAALIELPFARLDAPALAPLRAFLATQTRGDSSAAAAIPQGTKLVAPGSTKAVGTIVQVGNEVPAAVAMMRLEHLLLRSDGVSDASPPRMAFTTLDGAFHAVPFQPTWWPPIDVASGKMVL